jgi:hypothetical protein
VQKYDFIEPEKITQKVLIKKNNHSKTLSVNNLQSQLKDYRNKHKGNKMKNQKIWTLEELKKFDESQKNEKPLKKNHENLSNGQGPRMVQIYDSVSSFKEPRNLILRAFELVAFI